MGRSKLPPKFIRMGDPQKGTAMRLQVKESSWGWADDYKMKRVKGNTHEYYRDAGIWAIDYKYDETGKLVSDARRYSEDMKYLDNQELFPITEAEWRKDNAGYLSNYNSRKIKINPNELPY